MNADSKAPPARVRAGGTVLSLIAEPLTVPILRAHREQPLRLADLRQRLPGVAQTTLRGQVGNLRGVGALERKVLRQMPYTVLQEGTAAGEGILAVAETVEAWLARAPQGPLALGSAAAKEALRALIGGWGSTMLRALAARPFSLTELSGLIAELSYPAVERRLAAMRAVRLIEPRPEAAVAGSKPYGVTEWARQAVGPLVAAGRCECLHLPDGTERLTRLDVEAAFLLAVPLVAVPARRSGSCLLAVDPGDAGRDEPPARRLTGVHVEVEQGTVASCVSRLEEEPQTWALGSIEAWVEAILGGEQGRLRIGGERRGLVEELIGGMHRSLMGGSE